MFTSELIFGTEMKNETFQMCLSLSQEVYACKIVPATVQYLSLLRLISCLKHSLECLQDLSVYMFHTRILMS